jgi:hypothetical protein
MNSEEPPKLIDGEKAYEIWQSTLSAYEGEFSEGERFAYEFKGKATDGRRFLVTISFYGLHASVGAQIDGEACTEDEAHGFGIACRTCERVKKATEEAIALCKMRPKQYEQLKLF